MVTGRRLDRDAAGDRPDAGHRHAELERDSSPAHLGEQQGEQRPAVHAEGRHRAGYVGVGRVDQLSPGRGADVDPRHLAGLCAQRAQQPEPVQDLLAHVLQPDPGADRTGVVLLLEHDDVDPAVGEQAGQRGPRHPEPDHRHPHRASLSPIGPVT